MRRREASAARSSSAPRTRHSGESLPSLPPFPLRSLPSAQGARCRAGLSCVRWWRMASPSPGPRCREGVALADPTRAGAGAAAEGSTRGSIVLRMATRVDRGRRREGRRRRRRLGRGRRRARRRRSDRSAKMSRSPPRERRRARQLRPTGPRIPLRKVTREAGSELLAGGSMSLGKIDLRVVRFTASLLDSQLRLARSECRGGRAVLADSPSLPRCLQPKCPRAHHLQRLRRREQRRARDRNDTHAQP